MWTPRPFIYSVQLFLACQQINRPAGSVELISKAAAAATKVFFFTLALSACSLLTAPLPSAFGKLQHVWYSYLSVDGPTRYTSERERALHPNVIHYKRVHKLPMKQAEQPCPILLLLLLPTPLSFPMLPIRQQNKSSLIKLCTYKLSRVGTERQGGRERESESEYLPCSSHVGDNPLTLLQFRYCCRYYRHCLHSSHAPRPLFLLSCYRSNRLQVSVSISIHSY